VISDTFIVTLRNVCWSSTVTTAPAFATTTYTKEIWSASDFVFTGMADSLSCGTPTYALYEGAAVVDGAVCSITGTTVTCTPTDKTTWVGARTFFVRGQVDGQYLTSDSNTF